jgi:hypothetical protein
MSRGMTTPGSGSPVHNAGYGLQDHNAAGE